MFETVKGFIFKFAIGFIPGTILYVIFLFLGIKQAFTDDDTLTFILCVSSVSLAVLLLVLDSGSAIFAIIPGTVIVFSYHAVFWYVTVNYYNYSNVWEAVGIGFVSSAIYFVVMLIVASLLNKLHLSRIVNYIQRAKQGKQQRQQEKQQAKLQNEIFWLNTSLKKVLKEMEGYLSSLDSGFHKTPTDSRNLLYLLSSLSDEERLIQLGQHNVTQAKNTTLDNLNRLASSINELRVIIGKVKFYKNTSNMKKEITEFEKTIRHLDEYVKKQDATLLEIFKHEDHRVLYVDQVKQDYRNLVNQLSNLS